MLVDFFYSIATLLLAIPAIIVLVYIVLAVFTLRNGNRERTGFKITGSVWTIVICVVLLLVMYVLWSSILGNF